MWFILIILFLATGGLSIPRTRYNNLECEMFDPSFGTFNECKLKVLGRDIVGLNVFATMNKLPILNVKVNLSLWRKYSGYRSFMFNTTFDFCKFMAKSDKKLSFQKVFIDMIAAFSNVNHTCPFEHDIIVRNLVLKNDYFKYFPLPTGQYKLQIMVSVDKRWVANLNVHAFIADD
ncbi:GH16303 [Drosophila grimshawi]|uniref:GH16303 n=1 Tax=Drosophila grimshawi TaxID=7222 RepID=B4IY85_DROGR|nr:GH16303 [Drosophila grimshawi]